MAVLSGRIVQAISGFYYVEAADCIYECKAKGNFRKKNINPLVGDFVDIEADEDKGTVVNIHERKNFLQRPPVSNIDILFIVASVDNPRPNIYVIDKLSAFAEFHKIEPVIIFSKCDLKDPEEYIAEYKKSKIRTVCCSAENNSGFDDIRNMINGRICAFTGNSGVGKSSILNVLEPSLMLPTNIISSKLGRGKHTTRTVSLYKINDGYVADTPGFSALDSEKITERIFKEELADCFSEFADFTDNCRFGLSCSHISDKGCAVVQAVNEGILSAKRHESYIRMYNEVKDFKKWE